MTDARPLRAAIVGTGAIAHLHAEALEAYPGAELVAVVDRRAEAVQAFADRWDVPSAGTSLDDLLASGEIDVLHICTPPGVHAEQAIAAFEAGVHVICEKPAALSLDEFDAMIAAAERNDRRFAVVFQQRTGSAAGRIRELLRAGAFGRPLIATCDTLWFRTQEYFDVPWRSDWKLAGGGPTLGLAIHQIDLLAWFFGDWSTVTGQLWRLGRETTMEDASSAVLGFANGAIATVTTSAVSPREVTSIRIDTEKATITVDHLYGHSNEHWRITPAVGVSDDEVAGWTLPAIDEGSGHVPFVREVYDALRSGDELPAIVEAPARSFEIVTAIYSSAATGRLVTPENLRDDAERSASLQSPVVDRRPRGE